MACVIDVSPPILLLSHLVHDLGSTVDRDSVSCHSWMPSQCPSAGDAHVVAKPSTENTAGVSSTSIPTSFKFNSSTYTSHSLADFFFYIRCLAAHDLQLWLFCLLFFSCVSCIPSQVVTFSIFGLGCKTPPSAVWTRNFWSWSVAPWPSLSAPPVFVKIMCVSSKRSPSSILPSVRCRPNLFR